MTFSLWVAPESYPVMRLDEDGECFTTMAGNLKASDLNVVESGDKGFAFRLGSRKHLYVHLSCQGLEGDAESQ